MSTFSFYNAFDDVTVTFDDASPDSTGPFTITQTAGDEATAPGETFTETYADLPTAKKRFLEWVEREFDAVIA